MITGVKLALIALQIIMKLLNWARERELISQGQDIEIARTSAAILAKTEYARELRSKIAAMDPKAVDTALRDLEPK